ncbi:hypothetical protein B0H13DRAFT_1859653 [Mycena leptocephala]|nr:hypothetical protein B0H13DRAFT_1859653 [Mycena leptocephala]
MPKAALGQNLEPLHMGRSSASSWTQLEATSSRLRIELTVDFNAGTVRDMDAAKNVVYTREVVTKCRQAPYSQQNPIRKIFLEVLAVDARKWVVSRMMSETSVLLLEDGDGDRVFIVMHEALDYAIGILLRRLTTIQGMTDVGLDLRFNLQNQDRR